jgi:hypothetical protein
MDVHEDERVRILHGAMKRLRKVPFYLRHRAEPTLEIAEVLETLLPRTPARPHKKSQEIPFIPQVMINFTPEPPATPQPKREGLRPRKRVRYKA